MAVGSLYLSLVLVVSLGFSFGNGKKEEAVRVKIEYMPPVDIFNIKARNQSGENITDFFDGSDTFAARRYRRGQASETHMCDRVTGVPRHLTFITRYNYYRKYTHAYGIPIISSGAVSDRALLRACYVVRFLLADRRVIRQYLYRHFGRIGIMGVREGTTSIPEHRHLGRWWDTRARGLGGTLHIPISTGAEENLLCQSGDRYPREDIFLHEFSHGIQEIAIRGGGIPGYFRRLTNQYNIAKRSGLWRNTYAMSTVQEYFAEGTQSYFQVNDYSATPNGVHNHVNTRAKLRRYDPALYNLVREVFPCGNIIHDRCARGQPKPFRMNCDGSGPVVTTRPRTRKPEIKTVPTRPDPNVCSDQNTLCSRWAKSGYCSKGSYLKYMNTSCRKSCECCTEKSQYCGAWAKKGFCKSNHNYYRYMMQNCKKSCSVCEIYSKSQSANYAPPRKS